MSDVKQVRSLGDDSPAVVTLDVRSRCSALARADCYTAAADYRSRKVGARLFVKGEVATQCAST